MNLIGVTGASRTQSWVSKSRIQSTRRPNYHRYIYTAIENRDLKQLKSRLTHSPECIHRRIGSTQLTPLHIMAGAHPDTELHLPVKAEPSKKFIKTLLNSCQEVDFVTTLGETPLSVASRTGKMELIRQLLKKGAEPDGKTISGQGDSPLHRNLLSTVMFDPAFKIANRLVRQGADIHFRNASGHTLLFALFHSLEIMRLNSAGHPNPLYNDIRRISVYHFDHLHQKLEWALLNGAQVVDEKGDLLEICLQNLDPYPSNQMHDKYLRLLIDLLYTHHPKQWNQGSYSGWTFLHWAAYKQCENLAKNLVKQGFSPHKKDQNGLSPFDLALLNGNLDLLFYFKPHENVVKLLVEVPPDFFGKMIVNLPQPRKGFTTGLPGSVLNIRGSVWWEKVYSLYQVENKMTPMRKAKQQKDIQAEKNLIEKGWNEAIENDFLLHHSKDAKHPNGS